jgi:CO/xanthine dehydrogenase FAD-binding subunit
MPVRLPDTEAALTGRGLDAATIERAAATARAEVRPISDVRASAEYRRALAAAFTAKAVRILLDEGDR